MSVEVQERCAPPTFDILSKPSPLVGITGYKEEEKEEEE
eukprot:CAMPEP_0114369008 /NCGR_PEP_ID=MMETSP0101-20121206/31303_1 /TAXON_ID=38822 ORGANISM="Pteridomonas danica, Strain PT" /NCGR_SAMPLE_ID=MMETSP0101 /ASSEMBLY_ACC=CAM_ASM_000211 /LENGTH=38 /DNA_ID= /DNA_START= /DNA_END= /DNA_ORIENTATION=